MKYRNKPVVIDAWRWMFEPGGEVPPSWATDSLNSYPKDNSMAFWPDGSHNDVDDGEWALKPHIAIKTLEGVMRAVPGDYIIRGIKGELYPCKPDIFEATYELVNE